MTVLSLPYILDVVSVQLPRRDSRQPRIPRTFYDWLACDWLACDCLVVVSDDWPMTVLSLPSILDVVLVQLPRRDSREPRNPHTPYDCLVCDRLACNQLVTASNCWLKTAL